MIDSANEFSYVRFENLITLAKQKGYKFWTLADFIEAGCPLENKPFLMKHDLDQKPETLWPLLDLEESLGITATVYVRMTANDYNALSYKVMPFLSRYEKRGFEIGLHTNFLEYAKINSYDPMTVLKSEAAALKGFINVKGMSTHRDLNYAINALPWLQENWARVKQELGLQYEAYDERLMQNFVYVNEGYSPHLTWRNLTPEQAIETGKPVYMLTHPQWWWKEHPFEIW